MPGQVAKLAGRPEGEEEKISKRPGGAGSARETRRNERSHSSVSSQDSSDRTCALSLSIARAHAIPFNVSSPPPTKRTSRRVGRFPGARRISRQSDDASRPAVSFTRSESRVARIRVYDQPNTFLLQTAPLPLAGEVDEIYTRTRGAGIEQPNAFPSTIARRGKRPSFSLSLSLSHCFCFCFLRDRRDLIHGYTRDGENEG